MEQLKSIQTGHIWLILCCIFYLIWWSITFNPMKKFPSMPKYVLFLGIVVLAITGLTFLLKDLGNLPVVNKTISNMVIVLIGIVSYIILLYLTGHFLHRQVTTELLLIVAITVLELCIVSSIYGASVISLHTSIIMTILILIAAIISMVCYLAYYNLEPIPAFYDGMIPLILFGIEMVIQVFILK